MVRTLRSALAGVNSYDLRYSRWGISRWKYRAHVGGMWDVIGPHQLDFLVTQGLRPHHKLLDVGCGAMRGGIHLASYLDPGNYYGIDINPGLIKAARSIEMPKAGLESRVPEANLLVTQNFEASFGVMFDFALAVSLFSHLPMNHIRLSLAQTAKVMRPGGVFFATFFVAPDDLDYVADVKQPATTSHVLYDPYHYRIGEMEWAGTVGPWRPEYIGDWQHARGQQMMAFHRLED